MMNTKSKYDIKLIFISVAILGLAIVFYFNKNTTMIIIRHILESTFTSFILWIITVIVFVIHYFTQKSRNIRSELISIKIFGPFMDTITTGMTYATVITTSLTLLKGIYIQTFFHDKQYFMEFQNSDLLAIFLIAIFLLYTAIMRVIGIVKETYMVQNTEQVKTEAGVTVMNENQK